MLTVTSGKGNEFSILVHKAGQSRLHVKAAGISKQLTIKATPEGESIHVEIMQ